MSYTLNLGQRSKGYMGLQIKKNKEQKREGYINDSTMWNLIRVEKKSRMHTSKVRTKHQIATRIALMTREMLD